MVRVLTALAVLIGVSGATFGAPTEKDCSYFHEGLPAIHFYRQFFSPSTCYLTVSPMETSDLIYRSFLFSDQGLFMVFNSYGDGSPAETTGARVFYLLPRNQNPDRQVQNGDLQIKASSVGSLFEFNGLTGRLQGISSIHGKGEITEDPKVLKSNKGGVEIKNYPGLLLDLGFAMGFDPTSDSKRKSVLIGKNGIRCELRNHEIFSYSRGSEFSFLRTDQDFKTFLKKRCPDLDPGY